MAGKKYYAVKSGRAPGVYMTWEECRNQVHGYPDAAFKSFPSVDEAQAFVRGAATTVLPEYQGKNYDIYVDGSFQKGTNQYSWAFVVYDGNELVFSDSGVGDNSEAASIHNIAGELAAVMRAIKWADEQNKKPITIHHDYVGIAAWATGDWKAKNKFTQAYSSFVAAYRSWINFNKVRGHSGVEGNEVADRLAGEAIRNSQNITR